jgi:sRNA-binding regulator protein Hfq
MGGVEIDAARHNAESEHAHVTVFLFTGDQITGIVRQSEQLDNLAPPPMSA